MQFAFDLSQRCATPLTGELGQGSPPLPGSSQAQPAWPEKKMGTLIIIQEKNFTEKNASKGKMQSSDSLTLQHKPNFDQLQTGLLCKSGCTRHRTSPKLYKESTVRAAYVNVCPR